MNRRGFLASLISVPLAVTSKSLRPTSKLPQMFYKGGPVFLDNRAYALYECSGGVVLGGQTWLAWDARHG